MFCALIYIEMKCGCRDVRDSQLEIEATWNIGKDGHHSGECQSFGSGKVCVGS
jgi:transcription initiation factor TFIID subunit TAF12